LYENAEPNSRTWEFFRSDGDQEIVATGKFSNFKPLLRIHGTSVQG